MGESAASFEFIDFIIPSIIITAVALVLYSRPIVDYRQRSFVTNRVFLLVVITALAWIALVLFGDGIIPATICAGIILVAMLRLGGLGAVLPLGEIRTARRQFIGVMLGAGLAGAFIALAGFWRASFSTDIGFLALEIVMLTAAFAVIGTLTFVGSLVSHATLEDGALTKFTDQSLFAVLILTLIIGVSAATVYQYWTRLGVFDEPLSPATFATSPLQCESILSHSISGDETLEDSLVSHISSHHSDSFSGIATIALVTGESAELDSLRTLLLEDVRQGKYLNPGGSVKIWQYQAAIRAYYYHRISSEHPNLFSSSERDEIVDWFREIYEAAKSITLADFYYAATTADLPKGPYKNQEIGPGLFAVLSVVLAESHPEIAESASDYAREHGQGWSSTFRNPDDGIVYHDTIWLVNAYFLESFLEGENEDNDSNRELAFEWLLAQLSPTDHTVAYNTNEVYAPFDTFILGAYLEQDGVYSWAAQRALSESYHRSDRDPIVGAAFATEVPAPRTPDIGSCLLLGSSGLVDQAGQLEPDKVVLRSGWSEDDFYALTNLRFAGWHAYPGTNTITNISANGHTFVGEAIESRPRSWLPRAVATIRDRRIPRNTLNGIQYERTGLEALTRSITGFGTRWYNDPPQYAEVRSHSFTESSDFVHTAINDWHGHDSERIQFLIGDDVYIVADKVDGINTAAGVTWNLKGGLSVADNHVTLRQNDAELHVGFFATDHSVEIRREDIEGTFVPVDDFTAANTRVSVPIESADSIYITAFSSNTLNSTSVVPTFDSVSDETSSDSMALRFDSELHGVSMSAISFTPHIYSFANFETDARAITLQGGESDRRITFSEAELYSEHRDNTPTAVYLNDDPLDSEYWVYDEQVLTVTLPINTGNLRIEG